MQREGPIKIIKDTLKTKGVKGLYSGCSALVVGNSLKAGVRFVSYDYFKHQLADAEVCLPSIGFHVTLPDALSKRVLGQSQCTEEPTGYSPFLQLYDRVINFNSKFSWSWGRNDGSHFCGHPIRDNQVRLILYESTTLNLIAFQNKTH